jgi:hypothetical protein
MIDASGGVLVRLEFPAPGPAMHFFLCELGTPTTQQIIGLLSALHGIPTLTEPRLPSLPGRKENHDELLSYSTLQAAQAA